MIHFKYGYYTRFSFRILKKVKCWRCRESYVRNLRGNLDFISSVTIGCGHNRDINEYDCNNYTQFSGVLSEIYYVDSELILKLGILV